MRKVQFVNGEYYHIYNRGVDKRLIFSDKDDIKRFFQSMGEFNVVEPSGGIYVNSFRKESTGGKKNKLQRKAPLRSAASKWGNSAKLVEFICYCLNPNHFHFLLEQKEDKGIEQFMHRLSTGYTNYFNKKRKRSGALFQGRYSAATCFHGFSRLRGSPRITRER